MVGEARRQAHDGEGNDDDDNDLSFSSLHFTKRSPFLLFCFNFMFHRIETSFLYGKSQCSMKTSEDSPILDTILDESLMATGIVKTIFNAMHLT